MYDICHPAYYELCKFGCNDAVKTSIAFYVYIELCEVKCFWDVKYNYNEELNLFYFEVKKKQNSPSEIYIPWASKYNISLSKIEQIQNVLQSERLTFIFKSEDSSSISYTVTKGLIKPASPETTKQRKEKEEKKYELEIEIRKNTSHLYELAKSLCENKDQNCNDMSESSGESVNTDSTVKLIDIDNSAE
ncbi:uncharacterized protein LOC105188628 [Harpegnathos saltator]|uniref:uncharacterized protein LOC105188628 n=1 Tax=Harpegnathos saltator TaxID=610380 RepID=UPI00058F011E|nr:uncharacterized protein LOC105188628 [Harpegnathos saltator]